MRTPMMFLLALLLLAPHAATQEMPEGFREEFLQQFDYSAQRLVALAEAMPAESYAWRPMEGVASVADAYTHIARYNYYYPEVGLGVAAPEGVVVEELEGSITEKEAVVEVLRRSLDHVRETVRAMPESELRAQTRLYGRETQKWSVLLQLLAHMNEHVGQSIAYARMNQVVPPWSR